VKDLLETGNYLKNIYKNSQKCDISASHNNYHELLKRTLKKTINYVGLDSVDVDIFQKFLGYIECFDERKFEEEVFYELFELEDIASETGYQLAPINTKKSQNVVVPISNKNSIVAMNTDSTDSTDSTALVPANYEFSKKIVKKQIATYVRNGIINPQQIEQLLKNIKEIKETPEKPASEKTTFELMYAIVGEYITEERISALLTGNIYYFIKEYDVTIDMIRHTIAKSQIASINAKLIADKVMKMTSRGFQSLIFLVILLMSWYAKATFCVTQIIVNINRIRRIRNSAITENLAIENRATRRAIEN
jgi:hypothetical protein